MTIQPIQFRVRPRRRALPDPRRWPHLQPRRSENVDVVVSRAKASAADYTDGSLEAGIGNPRASRREAGGVRQQRNADPGRGCRLGMRILANSQTTNVASNNSFIAFNSNVT